MSILTGANRRTCREIYEENSTAIKQIQNCVEKKLVLTDTEIIIKWCIEQNREIHKGKEKGYDIPWHELEEKLKESEHREEIIEVLKKNCESYANATSPDHTAERPSSPTSIRAPAGLKDILVQEGPAESIRDFVIGAIGDNKS